MHAQAGGCLLDQLQIPAHQEAIGCHNTYIKTSTLGILQEGEKEVLSISFFSKKKKRKEKMLSSPLFYDLTWVDLEFQRRVIWSVREYLSWF